MLADCAASYNFKAVNDFVVPAMCSRPTMCLCVVIAHRGVNNSQGVLGYLGIALCCTLACALACYLFALLLLCDTGCLLPSLLTVITPRS